MNSTMVTAIEHHSNQQQPPYGTGGSIQTSNIGNSSRGPKSPGLGSPNGMVVKGGQSKKAAAAAAAAARSLSLQTKSADIQTASSISSPLTALSSPGVPGSATIRGIKRPLETASKVGVDHSSVHAWIISTIF